MSRRPVSRRLLVASVAVVSVAALVAVGLSLRSRRRGPDADLAAAGPAASRFARIPKIDYHSHIIHPDALPRALAMTARWGVRHYVNLSAGPRLAELPYYLAAARRSGDRMTVFYNLPWRLAQGGPGYGARLAQALMEAKAAGARGLKIAKGLGLGYADYQGKLIPVDSPELDIVFETAGKLGMPVSIHTGDPRAFWLPASPGNERFDELFVHPGWSYYGEPVPSWEELLAQLERRVARHPKTTIVGVHFGNAPEEPARVARMLDRYPNYYIDTAARIPEIGRHDPAEMRRFFITYQDRILFGTDLGIGLEPEELMLGSQGENPPQAADIVRFYESTWRYFETADRDFDHPTPIQGRWKISGINLPREVLEKLYHKNAEKLLGLQPVTW